MPRCRLKGKWVLLSRCTKTADYPRQANNSKGCLLLDCYASPEGFEVCNIRFVEEPGFVPQEPTAESEEGLLAFDVGPDVRCQPYSCLVMMFIAVLKYDDLSESIRTEFKTYLRQLQINHALAKFILNYVEYKKRKVRHHKPF